MSPPLVTIGIPTRNRVSRLERALRSALAQEDVALEIVVSDNASDDGTPALCRRLERAEPRLRYIRQPADIGAEANFRAVLEASRSPYFMWLADDDWIDPGYVATCVRVLQHHPEHVVVCGRGRYYRGETFAFSERAVNLQARSKRARLLGFFRTVTLNGPFYGVIRREALRALPVERTVGADWFLTAGLAYAGPIRTLDDVAIHRAAEGASEDAEALRRTYGLSKRQARHWYAVVARGAFRSIRTSPTYADLRGVERLALAAAAASLVVVRFGPRTVAARGLARLNLLDRARRSLERRR